MNIIFTCGGTAGHINPAIALAKMFRERMKDCNILFIGAKGGMEERLVPREGFELKTVTISNFQRKLTPKNILHNVVAVKNVFASAATARKYIREFDADVVVGMGGYASFPAMKQGAKMGIATLVHEANAVPGLTTKMVADHVDKIMVAFEESAKHYKNRDRVVVVGMPVRSEFVHGEKDAMKEKLGYAGKKLVVSSWGSLGARDMNRQMVEFLRLEAEEDPFCHVHATGAGAWGWMPQEVEDAGVELERHPQIELKEYIYNMPELMVAADLVISRAGASSLNEIAASGTPAIIVPSPNVTDNHQEKNARILEQRGGAVVIRESESSGRVLYETAKAILSDERRAAQMGQAARAAAVLDSAERIYDLILKTVEEKHEKTKA
ncbi:MAG: undecaprenyldiphospho-muramoylpentapeptide beta-N-acetylglucosaminyltransferase [Oscillospiraceae bacterium]|nr:undecaprenyldiphospho-muramoylpentapeptide beta-N-acetylglucosaminyltransferase [Oscillospiraceae bacterium]